MIIFYLFDQNVDAYEGPRGVNSYYGNNLAAYGGQPDDGYLRKSRLLDDIRKASLMKAANSNLPKQLLSMG